MIHIATAKPTDGDDCVLYYLANEDDDPVEFSEDGDVFMYSVYDHAKKGLEELS